MIQQTVHQWLFDINVNLTSQLHILGANHQLFEKQPKKSGEILYWKKRRLSEYVTMVIKNLFSNALSTGLIEKWLINHAENELNNFGLKIRIFDISKIKSFEKNIFTGNCSFDIKISSVKIFYHSDISISAGILLVIEMHCFERGHTLNLFCRVYYYVH